MYRSLHQLLIVLYALLPAAALAWAIWRTLRRKRPEPLVTFVVTCLSATIIGTAVVVISAALYQGRVAFTTVIGTWYFLIGLLLLMNLFRWAVREGTWRLFAVPKEQRGRSGSGRGVRAALAFVLQSALIVGLGLPLVTAAMLVYRVKVYTTQTPETLADCPADEVSFDATDGTHLAGWWAPAIPVDRPRRLARPQRHETVLMCGGFGDTMPAYAGILRALVADGYNVLTFDLRANGQSAGAWTSFGDAERKDVLGALRWIQQDHAEDAQHIFAIGFGVGGAAVIEAAADDEGSAIDAVAVFGTYARFATMTDELIQPRLLKPLRQWVERVALPIASAHAGVDLRTFAPADAVAKLWPRPLLVIHGRADHAVPFSQGQDLFRAAVFPKESFWVPNDHLGAYRNRDASRILLRFLENARKFPAV